MSMSSETQISKECALTPLGPTETFTDVEQEVILDSSPKKVVILKGKLIKVPRRPPELGLTEVDLAGLSLEGDHE